MLKHQSNRHHRTRGFKLKHALQICVLIAICFWLLYQVKHSHDRKKELERSSKSAVVGDNNSQIPSLGRKDLADVKYSHEEEREEDEGEHEVKTDEDEEHEDRGAGQHELDENDQEHEEGKGDGVDDLDEEDHDKGEVDEVNGEDESDEKESDKADDAQHREELTNGEDNKAKPDDLIGNSNDHADSDAREKHYNGDDASSAVARDVGQLDGEHPGGEDPDENVKNNPEEEHKTVETKANDDAFGADVESKPEEGHTTEETRGSDDALKVKNSGNDVLEGKSSGNDTLKVDDSGVIRIESDTNGLNSTSLNVTDHMEDAGHVDGAISSTTVPNSSDKIEENTNSSLEVASVNTTDADGKVSLDNSSENIEMVTGDFPLKNGTTSAVLEAGQNTIHNEDVAEGKTPELGNAGESDVKSDATSSEGGRDEASSDSSSSDNNSTDTADESSKFVLDGATVDNNEKNVGTDLSTLAETKVDTRTVEDVAAE